MSSHSGSKKGHTSEVLALQKQVADLKESAVARRRVEDAIRAAEELHRSTLDEAPAGILRLDSSGRLLYANPAFIRVLGYASRQDFKTIGELRGVFASSEEARRMAQVGKDGPAEVVATCLRSNGDPLELRLLGGTGANSSDSGVTLVCLCTE